MLYSHLRYICIHVCVYVYLVLRRVCDDARVCCTNIMRAARSGCGRTLCERDYINNIYATSVARVYTLAQHIATEASRRHPTDSRLAYGKFIYKIIRLASISLIFQTERWGSVASCVVGGFWKCCAWRLRKNVYGAALWASTNRRQVFGVC